MTARKPMELPENKEDFSVEKPKTSSVIRWYPYYLPNGNLREKEAKGSIEALDCPTSDDVEMAIIENRIYPAGKYKVEKKKGGLNPPMEVFYLEKPESAFFQQNTLNVVDFDSDEENDELENNQTTFSVLKEIIDDLRKEVAELREERRENQVQPVTENSDNISSIIRELSRQNEKASERSEKLNEKMFEMMMKLQSNQNQNQQQNPADLMLQMLQNTLAVQKGVKELSEEISPSETAADSSLLGGAAKLVDSLGRNAGTFLPLLGGLNLPQSRRTAASSQTSMPSSDSTAQTSNIPSLAEMLRQSQTDKDTEQ